MPPPLHHFPAAESRTPGSFGFFSYHQHYDKSAHPVSPSPGSSWRSSPFSAAYARKGVLLGTYGLSRGARRKRGTPYILTRGALGLLELPALEFMGSRVDASVPPNYGGPSIDNNLMELVGAHVRQPVFSQAALDVQVRYKGNV